MSCQSVSFSQFLKLKDTFDTAVDSGSITTSPRQMWTVDPCYGEGTITTIPLLGGAGLVVMDVRFHEDIEIFAEQAVQENLSLTLCLEGYLKSSCSQGSEVEIKNNETLFARYHETQYNLTSTFRKDVNNHFVSLHLSSDWLAQSNLNLQTDILNDPYWQGVYNSGPASQLMLTTAHEIMAICQRRDVSGHLISAKALELWSHQEMLLHRLAKPETQAEHQGLKARDVAAIHQAAAILEEEMDNPPGLQLLARRVGINDNKLKKGFRQVYGTTAFNYLQQYRLQQARELLLQQKLNVTQVAEVVGFKSTSHFASVFKQKFGISPSHLGSK